MENEDKKYVVPGRISIDKLKEEQKELVEAQKASKFEPKSKKLLNAMSMFSIATDFGLIIAVPLIVFTYLGKWLDNKYSQKYFILIAIILAITTSSVGIYKQIKKLKELTK
jgi:magnesium-transporting ATPase (P-type)